MTDVYFDQIEEGLRFESGRRTLSETDIVSFSAITGDYSPLHSDLEFIKEHTPFSGRIGQGWLLVSLQSGLACQLKSWRMLAYLGMARRFVHPVYPGDTIHVVYEVDSVRASSSRPTGGVVHLTCNIVNQDGVVVCTGTETFFVERAAG